MSVLSRTPTSVPAQRQPERGVEPDLPRTSAPAVATRRRAALVATCLAAIAATAGTAIVLNDPSAPASAGSTPVTDTSSTDLRRDAAMAGRVGNTGALPSSTDLRRDAAMAGRVRPGQNSP